jgi:hypothetical protein
MTIATLQDIRDKVRRMTGSANSLVLTDTRIDDYINSFYSYDLPAEFRSLQLKDIFTFTTERGVGTYAWDNDGYLSVEAPVYLNKREIALFYNEREFFSFVPSDMFTQTVVQGNGTAGPYTATLQNTPIIPSVNNNPAISSYPASRVVNFLIGANSSFGVSQAVSDISAGATGTLTGDGTGTINYNTGALSVTFTAVVPSGEDINVSYLSQQITRPTAILYLQNQLTLSPPPDQTYVVEITVYRKPTQVLLESSANSPELKEWWELIAAGAAKKVFEDRSDDEGVAQMERMLQSRYSVVETRTYVQIGNERVPTIFSSQTPNNTYSSGFMGW